MSSIKTIWNIFGETSTCACISALKYRPWAKSYFDADLKYQVSLPRFDFLLFPGVTSESNQLQKHVEHIWNVYCIKFNYIMNYWKRLLFIQVGFKHLELFIRTNKWNCNYFLVLLAYQRFFQVGLRFQIGGALSQSGHHFSLWIRECSGNMGNPTQGIPAQWFLAIEMEKLIKNVLVLETMNMNAMSRKKAKYFWRFHRFKPRHHQACWSQKRVSSSKNSAMSSGFGTLFSLQHGQIRNFI